MEKIYIITFHWATNYGAVLQSYALQNYLEKQGKNVEIINYIPKKHEKTFLKCFLSRPSFWRSNFRELKKEHKIKKFRKKYLRLTKKYSSYTDLKLEQWGKAIFICGSDQIWNPYFTLRGEGGATLSYYLSFAPNECKKIAYAASFGVMKLNSPMEEIVSKQLKQFYAVSVRENSAVEMLKEIGIDASMVCDPVFLNNRDFYDKLVSNFKKDIGEKRLFSYILHGDSDARFVVDELVQQGGYSTWLTDCGQESLEEWLNRIVTSSLVVTNSFHATAMAILFHVPFIALLVKGSGMNDRLLTLLKALGLENRVAEQYDSKSIEAILFSQIQWEKVDERRIELKERGIKFLEKSLR